MNWIRIKLTGCELVIRSAGSENTSCIFSPSQSVPTPLEDHQDAAWNAALDTYLMMVAQMSRLGVDMKAAKTADALKMGFDDIREAYRSES